MRALLNQVLLPTLGAVLVAAAAAPSLAYAQARGAKEGVLDAIYGTWVLNRERSSYRSGSMPLSIVRVYEPHPDGVKHTIVTVTERGTNVAVFVAEYDSMEYRVRGATDVDAVTMTAIDAQTAEIGLRHGGREIGFARRVISADGQEMTMEISMGGSRNVAVYDKRNP